MGFKEETASIMAMTDGEGFRGRNRVLDSISRGSGVHRTWTRAHYGQNSALKVRRDEK